MRYLTGLPVLFLGAFFLASAATGQERASIRLETIPIPTYPFSDPDPIPMLVKDTRLYPYHSFDGLAATAELRDWKVVVLENSYLQVFVLPDAGGKVWGAVEKSTGAEFIYRNEVLKFRNIALRGPWTSGGIEFNFGVIGHTPSTAAPVDYFIRANDDGSVSCFVGTMDLPSRTQWRVEIRLPADEAYFETNATWYNPTPVEQPYYNWMTAAAFAQDDLELSIPGDRYLKHSGDVRQWPVDDQGRDLSIYDNNRFESHKSYHVVGELNDFFGGYYTKDNYGFGHWADYHEMPGQKLWLWSLARDGGIWEDLLTDSDGQYVEFQAGRLFVQYSPGEHDNPITQAGFEPLVTDRWSERWFPVLGIGGLSDASDKGAIHVEANDEGIQVGVNTFGSREVSLVVRQNGRTVHDQVRTLAAAEPWLESVSLDPNAPFEVEVPELDLRFSSDPSDAIVDRPFAQEATFASSIREPARMLFEARELMKARWYGRARVLLDSVLSVEPWNHAALLAAAELAYRRGQFRDGLVFANRARQIDTYHSGANYIAGLLYRSVGDMVNAKESLGLASRSMSHRSAAFTHLAEIALIEDDMHKASSFARSALDYDRYNVRALESQRLAARLMHDGPTSHSALKQLWDIDPISHFVAHEKKMEVVDEARPSEAEPMFQSEFPNQDLLELALSYYSRGLTEEATAILERSASVANDQLAKLWLAYLAKDSEPQKAHSRLNEAFQSGDVVARPYRVETISMLEWVVDQDPRWQARYLLALNYWAVDRLEDAASLLVEMGDEPTDAVVYIARAELLQNLRSTDPEGDLRKALLANDSDHRTWRFLERHLESSGQWSEALDLNREMVKRFPSDFVIALGYARSLLETGHPHDAIAVLDETHVLPAEGSGGGRNTYSSAKLAAGIDQVADGDCSTGINLFEDALAWPEHLGQGKPYTPDERLQRFMMAHCYSTGDKDASLEQWRLVADSPRGNETDLKDILIYLSLVNLNRDADAERLLDQFGTRAADGNIAATWVQARLARDEETVEDIIGAGHRIFESVEFRNLDKALMISGL